MFQSPLLLEASTFPPFSPLWFNKMDVYFPAKSHRKPSWLPRVTAGHGTARSILLVKYSCKPHGSTRNLQNKPRNQRDSPCAHTPPRPSHLHLLRLEVRLSHLQEELAMAYSGRS